MEVLRTTEDGNLPENSQNDVDPRSAVLKGLVKRIEEAEQQLPNTQYRSYISYEARDPDPATWRNVMVNDSVVGRWKKMAAFLAIELGGESHEDKKTSAV